MAESRDNAPDSESGSAGTITDYLQALAEIPVPEDIDLDEGEELGAEPGSLEALADQMGNLGQPDDLKDLLADLPEPLAQADAGEDMAGAPEPLDPMKEGPSGND